MLATSPQVWCEMRDFDFFAENRLFLRQLLTGFVLLYPEKNTEKSLLRGSGSDMGYQTLKKSFD